MCSEGQPFSEYLSEAKNNLDLNEKDLANMLDVPVPAVRRWLNGNTEPRDLIKDHVRETIRIHLKQT